MITYEKNQETASYQKLYINRLWECRDFELTHFWQRSVFLGTFLVLIYTAYGAVIIQILQNNVSSLMTLHMIAIFITLIGAIFSIIWIMMAKGSKFWYELYERKIYSFEENNKTNPTDFKVLDEDCGEINEIPQSSALFGNTHAYRFSLTGLTIIMGQVSTSIFYACMNIHILLVIEQQKDSSKIDPIAFIILIVISTLFITFFVFYLIFKSIQNTLKPSIHSKIAKEFAYFNRKSSK